MKKLIFVSLVCGWSLPVMAFLTLPIADDAPTPRYSFQVTGMTTMESDMNLYGGRLTFGIMEGLSIFGGLGQQDMADDVYVQLGMQYTLPLDLSFDLALRAAGGRTQLEVVDAPGFSLLKPVIWTYNIGVLGSTDLGNMNLDKVTAYGLCGISHQKFETQHWTARSKNDDFRTIATESKTELAIAVGALYKVNTHISAFAEIAHIDNVYLSAGVSLGF